MKHTLSIALVAFVLTGCPAYEHRAELTDNTDRVSLGTVQKEIRKGMDAAAVLEALGSPNQVSTDAQGREVWVYDKVATESLQSSSFGFIFAILAGGGRAANASSKTQRTLTIIIKFDENNLVRDFSYHSSKY